MIERSMPFKFLLKKSRQYNVSTKSLYVINVELLDNSGIDCTLTADSTGRDCLENICQRLGLQQPEFFGLRFESGKRQPRIRWLELDKPVKRQLEKYGQEQKLFLGVMFYITDVHLLHCEITRYQYFLQLKQDVLEGKLACNLEQAINLAAYSLQAEFGDHDPERHTIEYLREFTLLPKHMVQNQGELHTLIELVIRHHMALQSVSPTLAEVYYILEAQKLDGYGVDFFQAKDEHNRDAYVGSSLLGIVVRSYIPPNVNYYRWSDISNLVNHKRTFSIECQRDEDTVQFTLDDHDLAKYVWKQCVVQHMFFKRQQVVLGIPDGDEEEETNQLPAPDIQTSAQPLHESDSGTGTLPDVHAGLERGSTHPKTHHVTGPGHVPVSHISANYNIPVSITHQQQQQQPLHMEAKRMAHGIQAQVILQHSHPTVPYSGISHNLAAYDDPHFTQQHPDLVTHQLGGIGEFVGSHQQQQLIHQQQQPAQPQQPQQLPGNLLTSQASSLINSAAIPAYSSAIRPAPHLQQHEPYSLPPSTLAAQIHQSSSLSSLPDHPQLDYMQLKSLLPAYRPAPDYETALRVKYGLSPVGSASLGNIQKPDAPAANFPNQNHIQHLPPPITYSSQPDLAHQVLPQGGGVGGHVLTYRGHQGYGGAGDMIPLIDAGGNHLTYSTPELNVPVPGDQGDPAAALHQELQFLHLYKPPPPYPYHKPQSTSSPDLASQGIQSSQVSGSTPDLLSNRPHGVVNVSGEVHRTYENLAVPQSPPVPGLSMEELNSIYQVNETKANRPPPPYPIQNQRQEPIYENIPPKYPGPASVVSAINSAVVTSLGSAILPGGLVVSSVSSHPHPHAVPDSMVVESQTTEPALPDLGKVKSARFHALGPTRPEPESRLTHALMISSLDQGGKTDSEIQEDGVVQSNSSDKSQQLQKGRGWKKWALPGGMNKKDSDSNSSSGSLQGASKSSSTSSSPLALAKSKLGKAKGVFHSPTPSQGSLEPIPVFPCLGLVDGSKENKIRILQERITSGEVLQEFEGIPKKRMNCEFPTALSPANISKNRFKDVLPYEENRVHLTPNKDNKTGYINASPITITVDRQTRFYIAAQGPLSSTVNSFWQMIWEQNVHLVVMLTSVQSSSCIPYWPQNDKATIEIGEYVIHRQCSSQSSSYVTSRLQVSHGGSKKQRCIWHLQYTDWADHGCPEDVQGFVNFLEEMDSLRRQSQNEIPASCNKNVPVLVHCSAGVGRTGVTILCDILLYCLDHNQPIELPKLLYHVRQQRMLMVQTISQYKFIYQVLVQYLQGSRLI